MARNTYSAVGEARPYLAEMLKPGMFGLGMAPNENFFAYSTQFVFLIRPVPRNVVMVAIGNIDIVNIVDK